MRKKELLDLNNNKEYMEYFGEVCENSKDLEEVCENLLLYHYTVKNNVLWNDIISNCDCYNCAKDIVYDLADCFKDDRKIYYKLKALSRGSRIAVGKEMEYLELTEKYVLLDKVSEYNKSICLAVSLNYHLSVYELTYALDEVLAIENLSIKSEFAYSILCEYYLEINDYEKLRTTALNGIEVYSGKDVCINYRNHLRKANENIDKGE